MIISKNFDKYFRFEMKPLKIHFLKTELIHPPNTVEPIEISVSIIILKIMDEVKKGIGIGLAFK